MQDLDCDYLVCSGYKIFASAYGLSLWQAAALEALPTFREDFIPDQIPFKIEVGTFVYENVAGMDAAIGYLEELGARVQPELPSLAAKPAVQAMEAIRAYEARSHGTFCRNCPHWTG